MIFEPNTLYEISTRGKYRLAFFLKQLRCHPKFHSNDHDSCLWLVLTENGLEEHFYYEGDYFKKIE